MGSSMLLPKGIFGVIVKASGCCRHFWCLMVDMKTGWKSSVIGAWTRTTEISIGHWNSSRMLRRGVIKRKTESGIAGTPIWSGYLQMVIGRDTVDSRPGKHQLMRCVCEGSCADFLRRQTHSTYTMSPEAVGNGHDRDWVEFGGELINRSYRTLYMCTVDGNNQSYLPALPAYALRIGLCNQTALSLSILVLCVFSYFFTGRL